MKRMRRLLLALALAGVLTGPAAAEAGTWAAAPDLTRVANGVAVTCWIEGFPTPYGAYFQPGTYEEYGPEGINLRPGTCKLLRRVASGWRPTKKIWGFANRSRIAQHAFLFSHEIGHAILWEQGGESGSYRNEAMADDVGVQQLNGVLARLGLGPWWRRNLTRMVFLGRPDLRP
jgi:hypothetical protein